MAVLFHMVSAHVAAFFTAAEKTRCDDRSFFNCNFAGVSFNQKSVPVAYSLSRCEPYLNCVCGGMILCLGVIARMSANVVKSLLRD